LTGLQVGVTLGGVDTPAAIQSAFSDELHRLLDQYGQKIGDEFWNLSEREAWELGHQAARTVFAPIIWSARVGDHWDVRGSCEFLGVSRQALYKRVRSGTALGLQGRGTTMFPVWQFDLDRHMLRPVVAEIIGVFREADEELDPLVIAAWATKANRLLGGETPAQWISQGHDDDKVVTAARRATTGLAA
jgi:hypothetical protein